MGSLLVCVMFSPEELKESDKLAEDIVSLASSVSGEPYFEDQVTLDETVEGWVSNIEYQGKVIFAGTPTKEGWRQAMDRLKDRLKENIGGDCSKEDS